MLTRLPLCLALTGDSILQRRLLSRLGLGEARHLRGRPRLAEGEEGRRILERFAALSAPIGTALRVEGNRAFLELTPSPLRQEKHP